ncbi:MAG: hypothetical protein AAGC70_08995 [Pseudomonadota bacterium]
MERYINALVGPNPKEAGVDNRELTRDLTRRIRTWTRVIIVSAAIGFAIVGYYVATVGVPA